MSSSKGRLEKEVWTERSPKHLEDRYRGKIDTVLRCNRYLPRVGTYIHTTNRMLQRSPRRAFSILSECVGDDVDVGVSSHVHLFSCFTRARSSRTPLFCAGLRNRHSMRCLWMRRGRCCPRRRTPQPSTRGTPNRTASPSLPTRSWPGTVGRTPSRGRRRVFGMWATGSHFGGLSSPSPRALMTSGCSRPSTSTTPVSYTHLTLPTICSV